MPTRARLTDRTGMVGVQIRQMIADELQGKMLTNRHSRMKIGVSSESKKQSVSKLRRKPAFQAAKKIAEIVEGALHLSREPGEDKRTEWVHYFAIPVEVDGAIFPAWFNVREAADGSGNVFYQFGVPTKEAAGKPTQRSADQSQLVSTESPPALKVEDFLNGLKGNLAEKIGRIDSGENFSMIAGAIDFEGRLAKLFDPFQRSPELRRLIGLG